ncbi:MAG: S41 family peptidase [Firmicutes bacterium]|nr:S41 family peptidase [Bacillota bacterium]
MKKFLLFLLTFVFVACNADIEPTIETNIDNAEIISERNNFQELLETANENWEFSDNAFLSIEDILYDIDFLVQTLEENFPFMGVAERQTGIANPLESLRINLIFQANSMNLDSAQFENLIRYYFYDIFFSSLAHLDVNPGYFVEPTSTFMESFEFSQQANSLPMIIEEEKIALIPVNSAFFNNFEVPLRDMQELQNFIAQIQGYEHVILDFTHIGGGFINTAVETFILPNLSEPLHITEFAFITNGEFPRNIHAEALRTTQRNQIIGGSSFFMLRDTVGSLVPVAEFAAQHNLTNINQADLDTFSYGFIIETLLQPSNLSSTERINFSSRLPFLADNIWLLISPNNGSAGAIFAQIAKSAGFTLVGEQTSHWNSNGRAFFQLPKTGHTISMDTFYITDSTGRNIEEFPTEPHYFNRPGMDALETVLAIIAEME